MSPRRTGPLPRGGAALEALVRELTARERDTGSGARPIVAIGEQEPLERLAALDALDARAVVLERRGAWHGEWAELDPAALPDGPWTRTPTESARVARWSAARPIVLRGAVAARLAEFAGDVAAAHELHASLADSGALRRFVRERLTGEDERFAVLPRRAPPFDPERDLERVYVAAKPSAGVRGRKVQDLWLKSGWLSTFDGEDSLRVRVSFGREELDDESRDLLRHRLVAELAERCFPASALVADDPVIVPLVERCTRTRVLFTQHIAYWNSPGGGALFHHDAFPTDDDAALGPGQLGVAYVQLSGATAWIALSTDDLVRRIRAFGARLQAGELPWVRAQLFPKAKDLERFDALLADDAALANELALPGCGALCGLVNRGPEFTRELALHGHGMLLEAGDAILLPNHGLARTCMHSVFCASDAPAFSLSLAIRSDEEPA
ncbi:MAG: hypothetical protein IPJ77_16450 [Planctomycetes bacterium]|nr:hypothetical protein [Planctomycetota bacterium]